MRLIDIHTHHGDAADGCCILSCGNAIPDGAAHVSVGLHPWEIDEHWAGYIDAVAVIAGDARVKAIGECGIDIPKGVADIEQQIVVLKRHIEISEAVKKPLILHVVKGQETVMRLRRECRPTQAWIIHGFRGKPEQLRQYIAAGFHISFGTLFNPDALRAVPLERLFIERDTDSLPLVDHYTNVAAILGLGVSELAAAIERNCATCGIGW